MSSLRILLPLLAVSSPMQCNSFVPPQPSISSRSTTLQASSNNNNNENNNIFENLPTVIGTTALAVTLSFSSINIPFTNDNTGSIIQSANAALPSISLARNQPKSADDEVIKELEEETRKEEKITKADAKKARVEKSREAFFEYDAKMAEEQERRIEAAERKAEIEAEKDKLEVEKDKLLAEKLKREEKKLEGELKVAKTKEEKALDLKMARVSFCLFVYVLLMCGYVYNCIHNSYTCISFNVHIM